MFSEYSEMASFNNDSENISDWRVASRIYLSVFPEDGANITPKRVGLKKILTLTFFN
jgi:hypothetical protein